MRLVAGFIATMFFTHGFFLTERPFFNLPPVVPYKALEKFSKALYGTTGGTYSERVFCPVMYISLASSKPYHSYSIVTLWVCSK